MWRYWIATLALLAAACGGEVDKKGECSEGEAQVCSCEDGASGFQACGADLQFGACECPEAECTADADCAEGEVCSSGECTDGQTADSDADGIVDAEDNCPADANPDQADMDGDGIGDACEVAGDDDGDGVLDADDNCPMQPNMDQEDLDGDGEGDVCDTDRDGDDVTNATDNCPDLRNPTQADTNGDGIGDACDQDFDGIVNDRDNCPERPNPGQEDLDGDGAGDECDLDDDGDVALDVDDNCPRTPNEDQLDTDGDGIGDVCDDDADGDGRLNANDNCPFVDNGLQQDRNQNGVGDACDDPDGDGVVDRDDNCPDEANPNQEELDADGDQISDCDERALGTDPNDADSDGDGLTDLEEIGVHRTDPTLADTDSDGLDDGDELSLGLDPNNPSTLNDGILDGDRDFVQACNSITPGDSTSYTNTAGWTHHLPVEVSSTLPLSIQTANATNRYAATVFYAPGEDVYGFVARYSGVVPSTQSYVNDPRYRTYAGPMSSRIEWSMNYSAAAPSQPVDAFRNALLSQAAPWADTEVLNLPATTGTATTSVRGGISTFGTNSGDVFVVGAVAPATTGDATRGLIASITDGTGIVPMNAVSSDGCGSWPPAANDHPAELFWVLDQSGSMTDDNAEVQLNAPLIFGTLDDTQLDYRMGVTNMDEQTAGGLSQAGWHTTQAEFITSIDDHVVDCLGCGGTSGFAEWGIRNAIDGLTYFRDMNTPVSDRARDDAAIVTVFITDEETQQIQDDPIGTTAGDNLLNMFEMFFATESVVYSLTSNGSDCGQSDGRAYRDVAHASGGTDIALCTVTPEKLAEIAFGAAGAASKYALNGPKPVSSTLRVTVNGTEISRSRTDGYEYYPEFDTVALFGTARPGLGEGVVVQYETF